MHPIQMDSAQEAVYTATINNLIELERASDFERSLRGQPGSKLRLQAARNRLDWLIERQADLDKVFGLMRFGMLQ